MASYTTAGLIGNALKEVFDDTVHDLVYAEDYILSTIETANPREFDGGEKLTWLTAMRGNTSYKQGSLDGTVLPSPGKRQYVRASVDTTNHMGSTGLTQDAIDRADRGGEASFFKVVKEAKDTLLTDLRAAVAPQLYQQQIYVVTANSAIATIALDTVQFIQVGAKLKIGDKATEAGAVDRIVVSKDIANNTITVNSAVTVTAANSGAWYDGAGPAATVKMESLDRAASVDRVLHGIDSTVYDVWDGNVIDVNGVADEDDVADLISMAWERGGDLKHAVTTARIQKGIAAGMQSQKRFNDANSVELKGGFRGLIVSTPNGEVPVVSQRGVPKGRLYAWDPKYVRYYKGPSGFLTAPEGGSIWWNVRTVDAEPTSEWATTYRMRGQLMFEKGGAGVAKLTRCTDAKPVW